MAKLRIAHLLGSLDAGGIETQLLDILPRLSDSFDFHVVTLRTEGRLAPLMRDRGIPVIHAPVGRSGWSGDAKSLARVLGRLAPSLVHAHSRHPVALGLTAAFLARVPGRIAHYYSLLAGREISPGLDRRTREVFERRPVTLYCAPRVREQVEARWPIAATLRSEIFPSAVDTTRFHPVDPRLRPELRSRISLDATSPIIGMIGRVAPIKNHGYLLKAAMSVSAVRPDLRIWIIGEGDERAVQQLREDIHSKNLDGVVEYKGFVPNLAEVLPLLDAFVLCSHAEGMPVSILEAWASGVPVVATGTPGISELICDGADGLLCDPANPQTMAERLIRLTHDGALRQSLVVAGRMRAEERSAASAAINLSRIYESAFRSPPRDSSIERFWMNIKSAWKMPSRG